MISLKSARRTKPSAAAIEQAADINARYGLDLPAGRLAIVTEEVPGLTSNARLTPFSAHDLIAAVQQFAIVDSQAIAHVVLDVQDKAVLDYLVQSVAKGFLLVLFDTAAGQARTVTITDSAGPRPTERQMREGMRGHADGPSQAPVYVATVGYLGYQGGDVMVSELGHNLALSQYHFRPVLGVRHEKYLTGSLEELVANGHQAPTISSVLGAKFMGAGTKEQMMAYVDSIGRRKH